MARKVIIISARSRDCPQHKTLLISLVILSSWVIIFLTGSKHFQGRFQRTEVKKVTLVIKRRAHNLYVYDLVKEMVPIYSSFG